MGTGEPRNSAKEDMGNSDGNPRNRRLPSRAIRSSFGMRGAAEDAASGGAARDAVHLRRQGLGLHTRRLFFGDLPVDDFIALNPRDSLADALAPKAAAK